MPCSDAASPPAAPAPVAAEPADDRSDKVKLGLTLTALTSALREKYNVGKTIDGVLVTDVDVRSEAARRGMKRGDVILQTNQGVVQVPADVIRNIQAAASSGRKSILLLVQNGGGQVAFVALPIE